MSRKKRRTRKQKQRLQARRERAASQAEHARESVRELLQADATAASIDQLAGVARDAIATGDRELVAEVTRWACDGAWDDDQLSQVLWDASESIAARERFRATGQVILVLMENCREEAGVQLARQLAGPEMTSAAIPGDLPTEAARTILTSTDEPWVVDLLPLADLSEMSSASDHVAAVDTDEEAEAVTYAEEFWRGGGGAVAIRGFDFQSEVGLLWVVRSLDPTSKIESVGLERIEDIEVRFDGTPSDPDITDLAPHVFIQAKTRAASQGRWTISRLDEERAAVLSRFADLHRSFPDANLLFVSDQELGGDALALANVCEKLRGSGLSLAELAERAPASTLRLTNDELAAVERVRRQLGDDCPVDSELSTFLSRLHFRTLQSELRDGAIVALGEATNQLFGITRIQHALLYLEVFERSKARATVSRERARQLVDNVAAVIDGLIGQATDASALVKFVDSSASYEPDPAFREGVRARCRHILEIGRASCRERV